MIKERAIVIGLSGNIAEVQTKRQIACSQCEAGRGCGIGAIGRLFGKRNKPIKIKVDRDRAIGQGFFKGRFTDLWHAAAKLVYRSDVG
jgi:positive regulator of sigma E activity